MPREALPRKRNGGPAPSPGRKRPKGLKGDIVCCRQLASGIAVHRERSDDNGLRTALLQRRERAANSRTGVDDVVDDRDAFTAKLGPKGFGDRVGDRKQACRSIVPDRRRVGEGQAQRRRDHQAHERAFDQRPTDSLDLMVAETACQLLGERSYPFWVQEKTFQVEPELAVMARLKDEVAFASRKKLRDLFLCHPAAVEGRPAMLHVLSKSSVGSPGAFRAGAASARCSPVSPGWIAPDVLPSRGRRGSRPWRRPDSRAFCPRSLRLA